MANPVEMQTAVYLLQDFLQEQKRLRDRGITIESLWNKQDQLHSAMETMVQETVRQGLNFDRYKRRIRALEERVFTGEDRQEEDTGVHRNLDIQRAQELTELKIKLAENEKKLEKNSENTQWWGRQKWIWVIALVFLFISALMTGCTGLLVWKITQASVNVKSSP